MVFFLYVCLCTSQWCWVKSCWSLGKKRLSVFLDCCWPITSFLYLPSCINISFLISFSLLISSFLCFDFSWLFLCFNCLFLIFLIASLFLFISLDASTFLFWFLSLCKWTGMTWHKSRVRSNKSEVDEYKVSLSFGEAKYGYTWKQILRNDLVSVDSEFVIRIDNWDGSICVIKN